MKWISTVILCLLSQSFFAQKTLNLKQFTYDEWKKYCQLLKVKNDTFYYSKNIDPESIYCALNTLQETNTFKKWDNRIKNVDSISFTASEINTIKEEFAKLSKQVWRPKLFPKSESITYDQIDSFINQIDRRNITLEEKLSKKVYMFAKPFYLRNNSICIFLLETNDVLELDGGIWIYLKSGVEWIQFAPLCYMSPINKFRR